MNHDDFRALIILIGIPLYAFCAFLCFLGWYRFSDKLFAWQGLHLVSLMIGQIFFASWYHHHQPALPFELHYWIPNLVNVGMGVGIAMWCHSAFRR